MFLVFSLALVRGHLGLLLISRLVSLVPLACRDNKERTKEISSRPSSLGQSFKQYSTLKTRAAGDVTSRTLVNL